MEIETNLLINSDEMYFLFAVDKHRSKFYEFTEYHLFDHVSIRKKNISILPEQIIIYLIIE